MKLYMEPIDVETEDHKPTVIHWKGRRFEVEEIVEGRIYRGK